MAAVAPATTATAPAGFWIRVVAFVIDSVILMVVSSFLGGGYVAPSVDGGVNYQMNATGMLISAVYFLGAWILFGTTIGMRIFGLRIVMAGGAKLTPTAAVIRFLGMILAFVVVFIGVVWVAFDRYKQGWHDKLAATYVIH
ncbi:MAG: RDD family protein [Chloroflexi bacterium]|nr:RDD family protein [Chloroflexota bacterium]MDE3113860.1 RDD family protein [Chloroflexota bacterium]